MCRCKSVLATVFLVALAVAISSASPEKGYVSIGGGNGDSVEHRVILELVGTDDRGILTSLEDKVIEIRAPGYARRSQKRIEKGGKVFDIVTIENGSGQAKQIYFEADFSSESATGAKLNSKVMMPDRHEVQSRYVENTSVEQATRPSAPGKVDVFKKINLWAPTGESKIRQDTKPDRPYEILGSWEFTENWYSGDEIQELLNKAVASVGGDAVLVFTCSQRGSMHLEEGLDLPAGEYFHESFTASVIRYTDKK